MEGLGDNAAVWRIGEYVRNHCNFIKDPNDEFRVIAVAGKEQETSDEPGEGGSDHNELEPKGWMPSVQGRDPPKEWKVPNVPGNELTHAIIRACRRGSVTGFQKLYDAENKLDLMPPVSYLVRLAVTSGWPPMLRVVLNLEPDPREMIYPPILSLPEIMAAPNGSIGDDLFGARNRDHNISWSKLASVSHGDPTLLKEWLDHGVRVNDNVYWQEERNGKGHHDGVDCLLQRAVEANQLPTARLLLEHGALPNKFNRSLDLGPTTPLIMAVGLGFYAMVQLLVANGGVLDGWAIYAARNDKTMAELLLELGADISCLILHPVPPYSNFGTALHKEAKIQYRTDAGELQEYVGFVEWLLENGIDFTIKNGEGKTAADIAEENGHMAIKTFIDDWAQKHEAPIASTPITVSSWSWEI